ncbi:MAG: prolyl oligopeptidase family serine peptidase, partial [Bacteroidota bacterium]
LWSTGRTDTLPFVTKYELAEDAAGLIAHSTGTVDSTIAAGIYRYDFTTQDWKVLHQGATDYPQMSINRQGTQVAFLVDADTTKARVRPLELHHWQQDKPNTTTTRKLDNTADFLPDTTWHISKEQQPYFSEDGQQLYFGIAPLPILQDTALLEEEIVQVEVWHYQDAYLYPQQQVRLKQEQKRTYLSVLDLEENKAITLATPHINTVRLNENKDGKYALGLAKDHYGAAISWEGFPQAQDLYAIEVQTGNKKSFARAIRGNAKINPKGDYAYWYSTPDTAWFAYHFDTEKLEQLTTARKHYGYDEQNDRPMHPYPVGEAAWTQDGYFWVYDRYDIWQLDPSNQQPPKRLTKGRENNKVYRYVDLDKEEKLIDQTKTVLLSVFDKNTKGSGYAIYQADKHTVSDILLDENYRYSSRPIKAKDADVLVTTRQNFQTFPDLLLTNTALESPKKISNANPQQTNYKWGSAELVHWTALDGQQLSGILIKPDDFDPNKKYPMLVNFYERSSDRLHRYHTPRAGRSTINYSYYASNGYLIFNPDVPYRIGYPGESAYNAVVPGVTALINQGFVDAARIGVQGHSWGGYQVAYLVTKTDLFACAESGAPVVNMVSAYGGIRWRSGLSRMFQYERTQSRIGGTLWEYPLRYIENSPIFFVDKINTPVLILHNDKDGAVPWYQGIEFFVAMRRLGKPAWLLNYNDEPHWPVKLQNRQDFQRRMQQFFDHYLKDAPAPSWMQRGVPALEKGILQGLD